MRCAQGYFAVGVWTLAVGIVGRRGIAPLDAGNGHITSTDWIRLGSPTGALIIWTILNSTGPWDTRETSDPLLTLKPNPKIKTTWQAGKQTHLFQHHYTVTYSPWARWAQWLGWERPKGKARSCKDIESYGFPNDPLTFIRRRKLKLKFSWSKWISTMLYSYFGCARKHQEMPQTGRFPVERSNHAFQVNSSTFFQSFPIPSQPGLRLAAPPRYKCPRGTCCLRRGKRFQGPEMLAGLFSDPLHGLGNSLGI